MPLISITQTPSDSAARASVIENVTRAYAETTGAKPESVWVVVNTVEREDWGIAGQTIAARAVAAQH